MGWGDFHLRTKLLFLHLAAFQHAFPRFCMCDTKPPLTPQELVSGVLWYKTCYWCYFRYQGTRYCFHSSVSERYCLISGAFSLSLRWFCYFWGIQHPLLLREIYLYLLFSFGGSSRGAMKAKWRLPHESVWSSYVDHHTLLVERELIFPEKLLWPFILFKLWWSYELLRPQTCSLFLCAFIY